MDERFSREELLLGTSAMRTLRESSVLLFGVGGVGSFAAEALARAGVGNITLCDGDIVAMSNINRQLIALTSTIGKPKTEVMRDRIKDINPSVTISIQPVFYGTDNAGMFDFSKYSYIIDAIDTVTSKLLIIERANQAGVPVISCMGAGNKLDPTMFEVSDIYKTSVCPLAKVMRRELRSRGIPALKVIYSREVPVRRVVKQEDSEIDIEKNIDTDTHPKKAPGSVSFVPSVAGLIIAGEVIKDLLSNSSD